MKLDLYKFIVEVIKKKKKYIYTDFSFTNNITVLVQRHNAYIIIRHTYYIAILFVVLFIHVYFLVNVTLPDIHKDPRHLA